MKRRPVFFQIVFQTVLTTAIVCSLACLDVSAQRGGRGGGPRMGGGGGGRIGALPAGHAPARPHFGGNASVVHRDLGRPSAGANRPVIQPNQPSIHRPDAGQGTRPRKPSLPDIPDRINRPDRGTNHGTNRGMDHGGVGHDIDRRVNDLGGFQDKKHPEANRRSDRPANRSDFKPERADKGAERRSSHLDGPDWKNWKSIDPKKIHDSVANKVHVNPDTTRKVREHFKDEYAGKNFFKDDWFKKHPDAWHPGKPDSHHPHGPKPDHHPDHPGRHPGHHPDHHPGHHPPPPPPHFWWRHPHWDHAWGWFATGFFAGTIVNNVVRPVEYYYGSNIVYVDDTVYINDVPYVSADEYYQQALDLADAGVDLAVPVENVENTDLSEAKVEKTEEKSNNNSDEKSTEAAENASEDADAWLSMGTFALVNDGQEQKSKRMLQIASDKHGHIRGNLVDADADEAVELYGSVDPKTQRVAFKLQGNEECVAECGLWNLTQDTVPLLIHVNKDRTEERTLVRLVDKID